MAFKPLFSLGATTTPGAITDAKGLLGGTPTTGGNPQIAGQAVAAGATAGAAIGTAAGAAANGNAGGTTGQPAASTVAPASPSGTIQSPNGHPASGGAAATGVYSQTIGGVTYNQNADGTWSVAPLTPDQVRASHGG